MAGVAHILLNLTFLPPCRGIAELRVKDIMAGHRKEPCVYIALLSDANPVDGCRHVVIDATPRNTLKHPKAMPVGIEQHLMRLQPIGPDQKCAAVGQLDMGDLKLETLAPDIGPVLAPIELERLAWLKDQRHENTTVSRMLSTLSFAPPVPHEGRDTLI